MTLRQSISHWRIKGLIQDVLSEVPGGALLNDRLQTSLGALKDFDRNIGTKVGDWMGILSYLEAVGRHEVRDRLILEVGTGWYPTLPLCFILAGARRVYTVDLTRHLNGPLVFRLLRSLEAHLDRIAAVAQRPAGDVRADWHRLIQAESLKQLLETARISYGAPQDASHLPYIPDESLDMVYSNSVLEHVHADVLPGLFGEAWRMLKPDGLMVHAVACNDHYAHFDKSISFVNYLRYSERQWRRWNNDLQYQNRLRAPDFIRAVEQSGFRILHEARAVRPGTREALAQMQVAEPFQGYSPDDLAATTIDLVAAKVAFCTLPAPKSRSAAA